MTTPHTGPAVGDLRPLVDEALQHPRFTFLTDSQEIEAIRDCIGCTREGITGALVEGLDGDYRQVWITTYRSPWDLTSVYECVRV